MVDGERHRGRLAPCVDAEDHRHGPPAVVEGLDAAGRFLARLAHLLQGLGPAVAVDQRVQGSVELRRVAEAVGLDRADEPVDIMAFGVVIPAPGTCR